MIVPDGAHIGVDADLDRQRYQVALSKPFVESIAWSSLADHAGNGFFNRANIIFIMFVVEIFQIQQNRSKIWGQYYLKAMAN